MLHPERESLYCSTHMGVMPPTSVLAGNKTVCTVGMSGKQSKCLCMSHSENIPHHQAWTSLLAHCAVVACRLHSLCDGHEQCCLHGAWMNLLLLCSLYPAACLRDHSPPLPLFHPERKTFSECAGLSVGLAPCHSIRIRMQYRTISSQPCVFFRAGIQNG